MQKQIFRIIFFFMYFSKISFTKILFPLFFEKIFIKNFKNIFKIFFQNKIPL